MWIVGWSSRTSAYQKWSPPKKWQLQTIRRLICVFLFLISAFIVKFVSMSWFLVRNSWCQLLVLGPSLLNAESWRILSMYIWFSEHSYRVNFNSGDVNLKAIKNLLQPFECFLKLSESLLLHVASRTQRSRDQNSEFHDHLELSLKPLIRSESTFAGIR